MFRGVFHARPRLLVTTPEGLQDVLNTHAYDYEKEDRARRFLSRILGHGLIVVEGKEHKLQRKSVAPAFHGKHIRDLVPLFWRKAIDFTNAVSLEMVGAKDPTSKLKTGVVEISALAQRITLDIIGLATFGRDFNTIVNSGDELAQQYETLLNPKRANIVLLFTLNMFFPPRILYYLPWKAQRTLESASINLRRICGQLVRDKKRDLVEKPSGQIDILSTLIKSGTFDDEGYVNQLLTFLAAGHETTSSALTWALWLLSTHPNVQERTRAEVLKFIPRSDANATMDASTLDEMHYLTAVCNEVLRLYPTVPNTAREAKRDTTIGNQRVPKGAFVAISPWAINRLPSIWGPDASEFNPDRWFGDHQPANQNAYNFVTFIHGPRSCIGQGFSRSELRCLLAATVRRFQVVCHGKPQR
ncbi:MAG: hypothetical protein M1828_001768 [Chrysothrix sp. TS-e1954]|nr:MAG: hypothetical protein M1828_001768 [Chrysothrix sp. TS-e1954]